MGGTGSGHHSIPVSTEVWHPIADAFAAAFGVTRNDMLWGDNAKKHAIPRHLFWRVLQKMGYSYPAIGQITGHHHTSVLNGVTSKRLADFFALPLRKKPRNFIKVGGVFGLLTVMERVPKPAHRIDERARFWRCLCQCGAETIVSNQNLTNGNTQSCGNTVHRRKIRAIKYGKADAWEHTPPPSITGLAGSDNGGVSLQGSPKL